jgi:hypothetical protein
MSHTPGPWRFDKDNLNVYSNGLVAQTFGHLHNGEKAANAHLIAAAPELLEALERARGQWIHSVNAEQCLAAIAKAKGGGK